MKKLFIACAVALASASSFASPTTPASTSIKNEVQVLENAENLYKKGDHQKAFSEFQNLAKQGSLQAIYNLGVLYEQGQGVSKSDKKAVEHFKNAGAKGFAPANFALAKAYLSGTHGLNKNFNLAKNHLTLASDAGMQIATIGLAELLLSEKKTESVNKALNLLDPLVKKGHLDATYLRALYDLKTGQDKKDPKVIQVGINALESSAKKAHIPSLMVLGNFSATGTFVKKDLNKAKEIFTVLDKANVPVAKTLLEEVNKEIQESKK